MEIIVDVTKVRHVSSNVLYSIADMTSAGLFVGQYTPVRVDLPPLPTGKVFMSVPLGHSRKPFILGAA